MSFVIEVDHLSKHYKETRAVDDISFKVNSGEVYGFLGQNGAGKSTTIRMLLTLIAPTTGNIRIFGHDLFTHRKEIMKKTVKANSGSNSYLMEGSNRIQKGMYLLEVIINSKERMIVKLIKE